MIWKKGKPKHLKSQQENIQDYLRLKMKSISRHMGPWTAQPSPVLPVPTWHTGLCWSSNKKGRSGGWGVGRQDPGSGRAPPPPASPRTTTEGPASLYWVLPPQVTLNGLEALRLETNKAEAPPRESASAPWDMCPRSLHHVFCLKGLGSKDLPQPVFCFHFYRKGTVFSFCFLPVKFSLI